MAKRREREGGSHADSEAGTKGVIEKREIRERKGDRNGGQAKGSESVTHRAGREVCGKREIAKIQLMVILDGARD